MSVDKRMNFSRSLQVGDSTFFATRATFTDDTDEWPIIEHGVSSCGVAAGGWLVRIQFDSERPRTIWSYGEVPDPQRLVRPGDTSPRRLDNKLTNHGFFEHQFEAEMQYPFKYGIGWEWTD